MVHSFVEGTVRIGPAVPIIDVLRYLGVPPEEVLEEVGLAPALFDDPDNLISFKARAHLLQACAERTQCEHFGLLVGQRGGLSSFGLIGYLVQHSRDVGSALRSLEHHFHLHVQGSLVTLEIEDDLAFLGYSVYEERVGAVPQLIDAAVALANNIMRDLCGDNWKPSEVSFSHHRPTNLKPYRQFFSAPLRFDSDRSGVYFPSARLKQPVVGADSELHRLLNKQVDAIEANYSADFPEQVRRVLLSTVVSHRLATSEQIARLFSIHSRTLHRRLKAHGTSFQEVADQCRFSTAQQLLGSSDRDLVEVAEILGYADTRAFYRAFKRWAGVTPAEWRADSIVPSGPKAVS